MPRCKRENLSVSLPVAFWSMPMGGALTVAITLAALRQTALAATSLRISPGAMAPNMIIRPRRFCGHGREENYSHGVGNRFALRLRRAEAGMRNGCADQRRGGVAMQVCMISIMSLWGAQCSMSTAKSTACGLYLSVRQMPGTSSSYCRVAVRVVTCATPVSAYAATYNSSTFQNRALRTKWTQSRKRKRASRTNR